jgi:hypothetical protein
VLESEVGDLGRLRNPIEFVPGKQNFGSQETAQKAPA